MIFLSPADDLQQDRNIGDFRGYTRDIIGKQASVLEIGPSHMPLFPKREGFNVCTIDHADQETLIAKYGALGVKTDAIERVDYVWQGGPISSLLDGRVFDYVFASHVIEHMTDFAGFLADCQHIIGDRGKIVLLAPDKRYCFDLFQPITDTAKVLSDYSGRKSTHSFEGLYREEAQVSVTYDGKPALAWWQGRADSIKLMRGDARGRLNQVISTVASGEYADAHEYFFTPSSFALIVQELRFLGIIDLRLETLTRSRGCEFLVILSKSEMTQLSADSYHRAKKELSLNIMRECAEAWSQLSELSKPINLEL